MLRMTDMKSRRVIVIAVYCTIILLTLAFIFGNSTFSKEESSEQSGDVVDIIKPIVDPQDKVPREDFEHAIRKLAHVAEFALLGFETALLAFYISGGFRLQDSVCLLFFGLLCANTDELIQSFTERGSMVSDVFIDFIGVVCGVALGYALAMAGRAILRRRIKKPCNE